MNEYVSWEAIMALVDRLAPAATNDDVPPKEGATLVRMLEQFHRQLTGSIKSVRAKPGEAEHPPKPETPPR
jgi:hypothetical protein